jgi:hypothetical protein
MAIGRRGRQSVRPAAVPSLCDLPKFIAQPQTHTAGTQRTNLNIQLLIDRREDIVQQQYF